MSAGILLQNLEKSTMIPDGSLYLAEMGDGSGTKVVTHETLTKGVGESLKVGNLENLQTEAKESLVAAINEAAQSGGGGTSVDILDTQEEIEANTESGKVAGALAMKEMYSELSDSAAFPDGTKFYPDVQNGVRGYNTDAARGADTFHPFRGIPDIIDIPLTTVNGNSFTYNVGKGYDTVYFAASAVSRVTIGDSYPLNGNIPQYNPDTGVAQLDAWTGVGEIKGAFICW